MAWLVQHFLPQFLYPLGLVLIGLVLIFSFKRSIFITRTLCVLAFLILFVGGNRFVADQLLWQLEKQFPALEADVKVDVIIVLGGITRPSSPYRQIPEIGEGGDRLTYAAYLYKEGKAPKILVSGGRIGVHQAEADSMAAFLMMLDVPEDAIIRERRSTNTEENAIHTRKLMLENGLKSALLVTSAGHMRRAAKIFEYQNIEHIAAPTDYRISGLEYYWRTDLLPEARHLEKTTSVVKEHLGFWYLKLKGY